MQRHLFFSLLWRFLGDQIRQLADLNLGEAVRGSLPASGGIMTGRMMSSLVGRGDAPLCPVVVLCWIDDFPGDVRALPRTALVAWSYWIWGRNVLTGRACGRAFRGRWIWDLVWRMGTNGILGWTGGLINPASETEIRARCFDLNVCSASANRV